MLHRHDEGKLACTSFSMFSDLLNKYFSGSGCQKWSFTLNKIQMVRLPFSFRTYLITKNRNCLSELRQSEIYYKVIQWVHKTQRQEVQPGLGVIGIRNWEPVRDQSSISFSLCCCIHLVFYYFFLLCYYFISLLLWRLRSSALFGKGPHVTCESI